MAQRLKRLPAMRETWGRSLGREDPLQKEMATDSSILAWRIPWTEEPGGLQSTGLQSPTRLSDFTFIYPEEYIPLRTILFILAARLVSRQQNKGVKLCRGEVSLSFLPLTLLKPSLPPTQAPISLRVCCHHLCRASLSSDTP